MNGEVFLPFAERAWDHTLFGLVDHNGIFDRFKVDFVGALVEGQTFRTLKTTIAAAAPDAPWRWPRFDTWEALFTQWEEFPEQWPQVRPPADELGFFSEEQLAGFRRSAVAPLIVSNAANLTYRNYHIAQSKPHHQWRLVHLCKVEKRVSDLMGQRAADGSLEQLPPYFPGDRTALQNIGPFRSSTLSA